MTTNCKYVGQPRLHSETISKQNKTKYQNKPSKKYKKIKTKFIVKNKNLEPRIYRLA